MSFFKGMTFVAFVALVGSTPSLAQNPGAAIGGSVFDITSALVLRTMKAPGSTVGIGPKRLDFVGVGVNKSALNVLTITNGTNSAISIESLSMPSSGFRIASPLTLPLAIPPQTQALLTVEFLPTRAGDYKGAAEVLYRATGSDKLHKLGLSLKGKAVQE